MDSFLNKLSYKHYRLLALGLIVLSVFFLYGPSLKNGFSFDDEGQVVNNLYIRSIAYLPHAFTSCIWEATFPMCKLYSNYYRPLHLVSYIFTYAISPGPLFFHLVSVLYYIALCFLVFLFLNALLKNRAAALLALLFFVFYPLHGEAVFWIASVPELLFGIFSMLALWTYISQEDSAKGNWLIGSYYFLALLSKETALAIPFAILIYDILWRRGHITWDYAKTYWRYVIVTVVYFAMRTAVLGVFQNNISAPFWERTFNTLYAFGEYIKMTLYPHNFNPYPIYYSLTSVYDPRLWSSAMIILLFALFFTWCIVKKRRLSIFGLSLFTLFITPALFLHFSSRLVLGERYLLLPSLGILLVAIDLLSPFLARARRATTIAAYVIFFALLAWCARSVYAQTGIWYDSQSFSEYVHKMNVARGYPTDPTYFNLAVIYERIGREDEAKKIYEEILNDPHTTSANRDRALNSYGLTFLREDDDVQALKYFSEAVRANPINMAANDNLAFVYRKRGDYAESLSQYLKEIEIYRRYFGKERSLYLDATYKKIAEDMSELYGDVISLPSGSAKERSQFPKVVTAMLHDENWKLLEHHGETMPPLSLGRITQDREGSLKIALAAQSDAGIALSPEMIFYTIGDTPHLLPDSQKHVDFKSSPPISVTIPHATSPLTLYVVLEDFTYYTFDIKPS